VRKEDADESRRQDTQFRRQVYIYRFIQLFVVAFALGTVFVKTRMSTTTLHVIQPICS